MTTETDLASRIQTSTATDRDRYPRIFLEAASFIGNKPEGARILSFGCSTGLETLTLAERYFKQPLDRIFGVDVSEQALVTARAHSMHPRIRYEISDDATIQWNGPYDAIFAMSVLCVWPESDKMADISSVFPFSRFDSLVTQLVANVKRGGLLVVYNSNYFVEDTSCRQALEARTDPRLIEKGYVKKFQKDGLELSVQRDAFTTFIRRS